MCRIASGEIRLEKSGERERKGLIVVQSVHRRGRSLPEIHDARDSTETVQSLCNCQVAFGWSQGQSLDPSEGGIHFLRLKPLC